MLAACGPNSTAPLWCVLTCATTLARRTCPPALSLVLEPESRLCGPLAYTIQPTLPQPESPRGWARLRLLHAPMHAGVALRHVFPNVFPNRKETLLPSPRLLLLPLPNPAPDPSPHLCHLRIHLQQLARHIRGKRLHPEPPCCPLLEPPRDQIPRCGVVAHPRGALSRLRQKPPP